MRILLPGSRRQHRLSTYVEDAYDNINTALCMEVKYHNTDDPFDDYHPKNPDSIFEATSSGARSTRGQLAMYADHQFRHQHRLFLFQLVITKIWVRFIYWDRSGAVVTEAFSLLDHSDILMKFLWRFAHATEKQRGWDESVTIATRDERLTFLDSTRAFASTGNANISPAAADKLVKKSRNLSSYPICKVRVSTDYTAGPSIPDAYREYLIGSPFYAACSTPGRGTRCYLAYDLQDATFKLLKDTWWVSQPGGLSEMDVYQIFKEKQMQYVLLPICGGIVKDSYGTPQMTANQSWAAVTDEGLAPRNRTIRGFEHGRLVQELACSLEGLTNSEELIMVIRDVFKCESVIHPRYQTRNNSAL